jgi:hypothetical protein
MEQRNSLFNLVIFVIINILGLMVHVKAFQIHPYLALFTFVSHMTGLIYYNYKKDFGSLI